MDPRALSAALGALLLVGCLGVSPEQRAEDMYPYDDDDEGPEHNPGFPCLVCHSRDHSPGDDVFALAGTVYRFADDTDGLEGVEVEVTDAEGVSFAAISNRAGNFMFEVKDEGDERRVRMRDEGRTRLSFWPAYPMDVRISSAGVEQPMLTSIQREGSCNLCHFEAPSGTSVGRIYLEER